MTNTDGELIRNMPLSKLRGVAPPMFTTTRSRYRFYMLQYVLILELLFVIFTCSQEMISAIAGLFGNKGALSRMDWLSDVQQRGVWVLFTLTGLLSSFPGVKDIDRWLLTKLHQNASIPDSAEQTAETLFESNYTPDPSILTEMLAVVTNNTLQDVLGGRKTGSLEKEWLDLRCLSLSTRRFVFTAKNISVVRVLRNDFDEIEDCILRMRDRLVRFLEDQSQEIPETQNNINKFYENNIGNTDTDGLDSRRRYLALETQALYFRLCRLCALAIFATESKPQGMRRTLNKIGFQVDVISVPSLQWNAIFKVGVWIAAAVFLPSVAFGFLMDQLGFQIPGDLNNYIPVSLMQVISWSLTAAVMHAVSIAVASKIKVLYYRKDQSEAHRNENFLIILVCYVISMSFQMLFMIFNKIPLLGAVLWAVLPTISGAFVCKYIDKYQLGKPISNARSIKQAGCMCLASLISSVAILMPGFHAQGLSPGVWAFTLYASLCAGLMGLAAGQSFQRSYSHNENSADLALSAGTIKNTGRRIIGDLLFDRKIARPADHVA